MKTLLIILAIFATQDHKEPLRAELLLSIDSDKKSKFFNLVWDDAKTVCDKTGLPMYLLLAQAALESGWGTSRFAKEQNNYLGIKYNHKYATFKTRLECFEAWSRVLQQSCYKELKVATLNGWLYQLDHCGYHQSENYSNKIRSIYHANNLDIVDSWEINKK